MSRETLGPGASPPGGGVVHFVVGDEGGVPSGETSNYCRVISVATDPNVTNLDREAATIAVLSTLVGLEAHAPGVWFNPGGGVQWVKLAPIISVSEPTVALQPGTFAVDENNDLWIYVDDTTAGIIPGTWLRTLYEHRERLADLWTNQPGTVNTFIAALNQQYPLTSGRAGVELDGVDFPQRVGDRYVSDDGTRAYERWKLSEVSEESPHSVLWKPLHREETAVTIGNTWRYLDSPELWTNKTGPCRVLINGWIDPSQVGNNAVNFALRINETPGLASLAPYSIRSKIKTSCRDYANDEPSGTWTDSVQDYHGPVMQPGFNYPVNSLLLGFAGRIYMNGYAGARVPFHVEVDVPDPRVGQANFVTLRWKGWVASLPRVTVEPDQFFEGDAVIWHPDYVVSPYQFIISRVGINVVLAIIENDAEPLTALLGGTTIEVVWP